MSESPFTKRKILVAVAWPYASGLRHIGHVAGFGVPSDTFARYHRLRGNDVLMVSGTDEHGTPVMVAADAAGESPRETADRFAELIREDLYALGLSYDLFTRTTTPNHYRVTRDLFRTLYEKGYIVEQETLGAFSASTGHTLPDRYIEGTCPICGFDSARGDQCDNCGNQLDPVDLIEPRSRIDGTPPVFRKTKHLFLDLPAFKEQLTAWIEGQEHWRPNVRRFSLNFIDELKPRPITRDLDWGVPIPVEGYEADPTKKIYVWFDAVIGYLSAAIEWATVIGQPDAWREWWQNPDAEHVYFMGKDNIVFHTVIWPSILLGYGEGGEFGAGRGPLELPDTVASSEFLTMEGKKFSSSRGAQVLIRDFLSRYDADALRYFLSIAGPETQDTDFTWSEFVRRNNDELVATWGNLVNRTLQSAYKNFGAVPEPGPLTDADEALLAEVERGFETVGSLIEATRFKNALQEILRLAGLGNTYLAEQAPWTLLEADRERAGTILYVALRTVDSLKVLLSPFLPFSAQRLHELLGYDGVLAGPLEIRAVADGEEGQQHSVITGDYTVGTGRWEPSALPPGQALRTPEPLYAKLDPDIVVAEELARMEAAAPRVTDSHAHLDACEEPARVLVERAAAAGVTRIVTIGTGIASCRRALAIADDSDGVVAALGIDPHQAASPEARRLDELRELLAHPKAVAVGETGLDNAHRFATPEEQRRLLDAQLGLAHELGLPVVIHSRDAAEETAAALAPFDGTVVLHCFSSPGLLDAALERGYYVSFAGNATYPKAPELRDAARAVPADRILVETDSPYLAPQPVRGRRNEPAYVVHTIEALAEARGESVSTLAERTHANAAAAFGLA